MPTGKAAVRFSALQHGLGPAGRTWLQICSQVLGSSFLRELRPVGSLEQFVFRQLVIDAWRLQRDRYLKSGFSDLEILDREPDIEERYGELTDPQRLAYCLRGERTDSLSLASLSRHQSRLQREARPPVSGSQRLAPDPWPPSIA